jgi:hypothetical protein
LINKILSSNTNTPLQMPQLKDLTVTTPKTTVEDSKSYSADLVVRAIVLVFNSSTSISSSSDYKLQRFILSLKHLADMSNPTVQQNSSSIAKEKEDSRGKISTGLLTTLGSDYRNIYKTFEDPNNPFHYLDGTLLSQTIKFIGDKKLTFDMKNGNARAYSNVIPQLLAVATSAAQIDSIWPGGVNTLQTTVKQLLATWGEKDAPSNYAYLLAGKTFIQGLVNGLSNNDPAVQNIATPIVDFVTNLIKDNLNSSPQSSPAEAMSKRIALMRNLNITVPSSIFSTVDDKTVDANRTFLNAVLAVDPTKPSSPEYNLYANLLIRDNKIPLFTTNGAPSIFLDSNSTSVDEIWRSVYFDSRNENNTNEQPKTSIQSRVNSHLDNLAKTANINTATILNYKGALLQNYIIDQALGGFEAALGSGNGNIIDTAYDIAVKALGSVRIYDLSNSSSSSSSSNVIDKNTNFTNLSNINGGVTLKTNVITAALEAYKNASSKGQEFQYNNYPVAILDAFETLKDLKDQSNDLINKSTVTLSKATITNKTDVSLLAQSIQNISVPDYSLTSIAQIREVGGEVYTFEVMPATRSMANTQGHQAPGASHGISIRSSLNIAKLNVPGGLPIHQIMGVNEEIIEFCGAFLGMRSQHESDKGNIKNSQGEPLYYNENQRFRAYQESERIRNMQLRGKLLTLTIKSYRGKHDETAGGIHINVNGYIQSFQRYVERDERVWYQVMFRVTEFSIKSKPNNQQTTENPTSTTLTADASTIPLDNLKPFGQPTIAIANNIGSIIPSSLSSIPEINIPASIPGLVQSVNNFTGA